MSTATYAQPRATARRFALAFLAWGLGIFALLRLPWFEAHVVLPATLAQGRMATLITGAPVLPVAVTLACSGADLFALCLGAVLAYPVRWRARLAGAAGGLVLILALNTLRIGTLGRAAGSPALFEALHLHVWPVALALLVAAYVFGWMRVADRRGASAAAGPARKAAPVAPAGTRRFMWLTAVCLVIFGAMSPLLLDSAWVLAVAAAVARAGAALLGAAGIAAVASDNALITARGGFAVTQECIVTPLLPVYVAAVIAFAGGWRRMVPALAATVPLFMALGVLRLLVVALPAQIVDSPLWLIHAFYQLLTACVLVAAAAVWWRGPGAPAWRRAAAGIAGGGAALWLIAPLASRALAAALPAPDAQGAVALMPAFQIALFGALWIAMRAPLGWRLFALGVGVLAASQAAVLAAMHATAFVPAVPAVRAWAIGGPLAIVAGLEAYARPRS